MKPNSDQNARVGQVRKKSFFTSLNLNSIVSRIDNQTHIITDLETK
ncbi:hypothetical protein [Formosa sp. S-31]